MCPTDGGGYAGDEPLDWLWDLEGYDVGPAGAGGAAGDEAGAAPISVRKHLRRQPLQVDDFAADEFATAAFAVDPPTGPIGVPPGLPDLSPAMAGAPSVSPMDDEDGRRSRRPLMAAAVLLIIGLATGVVLAMSGGKPGRQVAQPAKFAAAPTTVTTPDTVVVPESTTVAPPAETTTVQPAVTGGAPSAAVAYTPPGTTVPAGRRPAPTPPPRTTPGTTPRTTPRPPATAPATAPPTAPATAPPTAPPSTAPPSTAPPSTSPPSTAPATAPQTATTKPRD